MGRDRKDLKGEKLQPMSKITFQRIDYMILNWDFSTGLLLCYSLQQADIQQIQTHIPLACTVGCGVE